MEKSYVLGTDQEELDRLNLQHELWKTYSLSAWDQAGFQTGQSLLDLGCGPGFTSRELARRVGQSGSITAVDVSSNFLAYLNSTQADSYMAPIHTVLSPIEELNLAQKNFDGAYCRWLMIFVKDPEQALRAVFNHLKPGGTFVLQEYVAYESMSLAPEYPIMPTVVQAIFKSWRDQGGDPNRGRDLPRLLEKVGFKNIQINPILRFARPQDPLWAWPDSFYKSFVPRLVQTGYLSSEQSQEFFKTWQQAAESSGHFFIAPTMISIQASKN